MPLRTDIDEVKTILNIVSGTTDDQITKFITVSSNLVDEVLGELDITDRAKHIETYLTAHLLSLSREKMSGQVTESAASSEAKVKYNGDLGRDLDATHYGQVVKLLDTSGKFSDRAKTRAVFDVI